MMPHAPPPSLQTMIAFAILWIGYVDTVQYPIRERGSLGLCLACRVFSARVSLLQELTRHFNFATLILSCFIGFNGAALANTAGMKQRLYGALLGVRVFLLFFSLHM